jgi:hypothetical protein
VRPGAVVVNIGTVFDEKTEQLLGDVDEEVAKVRRMSGRGPLLISSLRLSKHFTDVPYDPDHQLRSHRLQVAGAVTPVPRVDASTGAVSSSGIGPMTVPLVLLSTLTNAVYVFPHTAHYWTLLSIRHAKGVTDVGPVPGMRSSFQGAGAA